MSLIAFKTFFILCNGYGILCQGLLYSEPARVCDGNITINCTENSKVEIVAGNVFRPSYACMKYQSLCTLSNETVHNLSAKCWNGSTCGVHMSVLRDDSCIRKASEETFRRIRISYTCNGSQHRTSLYANKMFNLNKCEGDQSITIKSVTIVQRLTGMCSYCKDYKFCDKQRTLPKKKLGQICNGTKECEVSGNQFLNLTDSCMRKPIYTAMVYNCTEDPNNLGITDAISANDKLDTVGLVSGVIVGLIVVIAIVLIALFIKNRKKLKSKEIPKSNKSETRSSVYSIATVENTATYEYAEITTKPSEDRCSNHKTDHTCQNGVIAVTKGFQQTSASITANKDIDGYMEVFDSVKQEKHTRYTQRESHDTADDVDTYMDSAEGVYDHLKENRHVQDDVNIYHHSVDGLYDSGDQIVSRDKGGAGTYDRVAFSDLNQEYTNLDRSFT